MKFLLAPFFLACFAVQAAAADPTPAPQVILPDAPQPLPPPKPDPAVPTVLGADQMYVVRATVHCVVLTSPKGLVKVTAESGPIKIKAKFVDGDGTYQCRTFQEKYVWTIEAVGKGPCELLIIPDGADESGVIRRALDVGGVGPTPPIPPDPPSPTDPFAAAVQAAYKADTDADKAKSAASLAALYRAAASLSGSSKFSTLAGVMTWTKGSEDIATTAIPATRKAIGAELNKVLPTDPNAALDAATRALLAKHFTRVAVALESAK